MAFITVLVLVSNYYLVSLFGFNQENFGVITGVLIVLAVLLNLFLSKPLLEPLFKSDANLQKTIKETLHELNIPASTIQANVQMLEKNIKDEKSVKRLGRIKQATNELLKLYNQMEYEIKKEIDKIEKQSFDLHSVIEESVTKFDDIKNGIDIEIDVPSIELYSDKNGLQKVIDNLLSNAIKYNIPNGQIKIGYEEGILSIYNSGKAIDTQNIFMVFEQYYQEDTTKEGFGLGLTMVKEFCDKHAIEIKIDSLDNGTKFYLKLTPLLTSSN